MATATVEFKIPEFKSGGSKEVKFKELDTCEDTFRGIWKSFPKNLDENWESIEFDFKEERIQVCRHWLIETDFDFELSHQIIS